MSIANFARRVSFEKGRELVRTVEQCTVDSFDKIYKINREGWRRGFYSAPLCDLEELGGLGEMSTSGEFGTQGAHGGNRVVCASGAHEGRADNDTIGNLGDGGSLRARADAKADGEWQLGVAADALDKVGEVGRKFAACACDAGD